MNTKLLIDNGWIEGNDDYVSLTDIERFKTDGEINPVIKNWMRKVDALVYLKLWEQINNINFKPTDFEGVKSEPGENAFTISKKWIELTNAMTYIKVIPYSFLKNISLLVLMHVQLQQIK